MAGTAPAGVILYGGPASGKDTVTAEMTQIDPRLRLYRRLKVGTGRTTGYRIGTAEDLARLDRADRLLYVNQRYDSIYAIDRDELDAMLADGVIPVIHVGQPEAVTALLDRARDVRWTVAELWCPRDVAEIRIEQRATGDTAARLRAWDETPRLHAAELHLDTARIAPDDAAERIVASAAPWTMVVPAMHLVDPSGVLDRRATRAHALAAGPGWVDYFLINGSTTSAANLTAPERRDVLDIWLDAVDADRLISCAWSTEDLETAADRGVTPMSVLQVRTPEEARHWLAQLPDGGTIYSHPMYGGATFDPDLARWAATTGHLPAAGKLAKVGLPDLAEIAAAAPTFAAWDGSSRHIHQSLVSGAAGVVATPLAARLAGLPARRLTAVQAVVDDIQAVLDQLPDRRARRDWLRERITSSQA